MQSHVLDVEQRVQFALGADGHAHLRFQVGEVVEQVDLTPVFRVVHIRYVDVRAVLPDLAQQTFGEGLRMIIREPEITRLALQHNPLLYLVE